VSFPDSPSNEVASQVFEAIICCSSFVVVSHYNPDADAYGSSAAVALALRELGKRVVLVNESGIVERYRWMPGVGEVTNRFPDVAPECVIVCDCGALDRVGDSIKGAVVTSPRIINIDHHVSNEGFGSINLVEVGASSTSEVVFEVLSRQESCISPKVATCLLAGIYGDTGSFRYGSTTQKTFEVALELVKRGAVPHEIASHLFSQVSLAGTMLQSAALLEMQMHQGGTIAELIVPRSHYEKYGAIEEDTAVLCERARDIAGVIISVLIREDEGLWRVSLRTKDKDINLSEIAAAFGGGGHRAAAAFRWRKPLEELRSTLLPRLKEAVIAGSLSNASVPNR
jgi:phosphoesterase RecJ-like protein